MSNMLLYLPAKTTSVLQALDQGVITVVKQNIKMKVARFLANIFMALNVDDIPDPDRVNVKQAVEWACSLSSSIPNDCIRNYWTKTGILPDNNVTGLAELSFSCY